MFSKKSLIISAAVLVISAVAYFFFRKDIQEIIAVNRSKKMREGEEA